MKLRPVTEQDSENIIKWRNDPRISKFFFEKITFTLKGHKKWFKEYLKRLDREVYFIIEKEGTDIGTISIKDIKDGRGEVVRVLIAPEFQGKGHGCKALNKLSEYAKNRGISKLYVFIYNHNISSRHSFGKAGYRFIEEKADRCLYEKELR